MPEPTPRRIAPGRPACGAVAKRGRAQQAVEEPPDQTLHGCRLKAWLLLGETVNRAETPDQVSAVDANHFAVRQPLLQGAHGRAVAVALAEGRHQQRAVGEIEVQYVAGTRWPSIEIGCGIGSSTMSREAIRSIPCRACGGLSAGWSNSDRACWSRSQWRSCARRRSARDRRCGRRCRRPRCLRPARRRGADRNNLQILFDPRLESLGFLFYQQARGRRNTVPAPLQSTAPPSMTMPGSKTDSFSSFAIRVGTRIIRVPRGILAAHALNPSRRSPLQFLATLAQHERRALVAAQASWSDEVKEHTSHRHAT